MSFSIGDWQSRVKDKIRQRLPPGLRYDAEADERLESLLNMTVPSDEDLVAMQLRGELRSDEELARAKRR
jgi:hypothetical protein